MFIYGNALQDYLDQVIIIRMQFNFQIETQFYCKLLDLNSINFEYSFCNFSKRHMRCKVSFCTFMLNSDRTGMKIKQKQGVEEQQQPRSLAWSIHIRLNVAITQLPSLNQSEILSSCIKEVNGSLLRLRKVILNQGFM